MAFEVRKLRAEDDRSGFNSGNVELDRFFLRYAGQNQFRHHIGTSYVAVDERGTIAAFVTVAASEIAPEFLPPSKQKRLPKYPLPVLRVVRLAVDTRFKGQGLGGILLRSMFALAVRMADDLGCAGIVVDAKPESAAFYAKFGFFDLVVLAGELGDRPQPRAMFLELGQVSKR